MGRFGNEFCVAVAIEFIFVIFAAPINIFFCLFFAFLGPAPFGLRFFFVS